MIFPDALDKIMKGGAARRTIWNEDTFIYAQLPAIIGKDVVPKMTSLSDEVKAIFEKRFNDSLLQINAIYFSAQMAIADKSNSIKGYSPSVEDVMAIDWEFYKS